MSKYTQFWENRKNSQKNTVIFGKLGGRPLNRKFDC
nr:MAG TPA: hypothetical protein [Caudoviricetes sp.]